MDCRDYAKTLARAFIIADEVVHAKDKLHLSMALDKLKQLRSEELQEQIDLAKFSYDNLTGAKEIAERIQEIVLSDGIINLIKCECGSAKEQEKSTKGDGIHAKLEGSIGKDVAKSALQAGSAILPAILPFL